MSAAVNDRPHDVFLSHPRLPLTGELHPLRREFARWLVTGNAVALTVALLACTTVYLWPREATVEPAPSGPKPHEFNNYWPDPGTPAGPVYEVDARQVIPPHFIPEPVEELPVAREATPGIGTPGDGVPREGITDPYAGGGDITVDLPAPPAGRDAWTYFDDEPVLLSCEPPVYPAIVRDAGIDGTVLVRVLIGVDGRVKDAYVLEGISVLHDAALASARTAVFKPALAGGHPVEVWMGMPITFRLSGRR